MTILKFFTFFNELKDELNYHSHYNMRNVVVFHTTDVKMIVNWSEICQVSIKTMEMYHSKEGKKAITYLAHNSLSSFVSSYCSLHNMHSIDYFPIHLQEVVSPLQYKLPSCIIIKYTYTTVADWLGMMRNKNSESKYFRFFPLALTLSLFFPLFSLLLHFCCWSALVCSMHSTAKDVSMNF